MLDVLPFAPELILQYFDLVILGIVLLCALVGFIRGTYKSTYYFIVTLVIFLVSWFLFDPIAKAILNFDMSSFNISIDGTKLTTLKEYVFNLISTNSPDFAWIVENGSYSSALVVDVLTMAIRLVLLILTIILSFTLYRIISGIIWLIVRPKKSKRKKKKIGSRFGGMGIGALKGLGYSLLLVFIIAGISSVTQSITSITEETNEHALVLVGDTATLVKLDKDSNNLDDTIFGEYSDVIDLLNGYHDTITGKIFGAVKFGKAGSIDEMMFDSIFSVKNKNGNVKLRKELQTVAKALSTDAVKEIMSDGFSTEKLFELDKEDIKKIADALSELKIVKVVVPVGLEFVLYSDVLGEEFASIKEELANNFAQFNDINYSADIKRLGYAFADFTDLIPGGDFENIDYLNLDADLVDQIMSQIGELELLETVAPIAVSYILNMENIKSIFEEMNMPIEDLGLTDLTGKDWQTELGVNLPSIYRSFQEIGIKMIESEIDLTDIDISKVDNLSEKIMDSKILGKAVPVLSKFAVNEFLPDQYNDLFDVKVFDEITQENLWGDELKNLLKAAITLVQKGIMEPDVDPLQVIKDLKAKDIEDLGLYLSQSIIITKHLNPLIDFLFAGSIFGDGTLQGLSDEEWQNPLEIQSLFFAIQDIVITGLLESDDPMSSIGSLDDARIQSLSDNLSSSKFITKNLNPIISLVMEQAGFEKDTLQGLTDEEWQDKNELRSLLMGIKDIFSIGLLDSNDPMSALGNLEDTQIHSLSTNLSSSKFITKNLNPILDMVMSNANLGFEIQGLDESKGEKWTETELYSVFNSICILAKNNIISDSTSIKSFKNIEDNAIEDLAKSISNSVFMKKNLSGIMDFALDEVEFNIYHLNQDEWTVTEIDAIFKSVKIVANMSENGEFSIDTIMNIEENDLDTFLQSKLMRESIKNTLIDLAQDGKELEVLKGVEENPNPNKYVWDDVTSPTTISLKNQSYDITPVTNANKYYIYGDGIFLGSTSLTSINLDSFNETFLNNNTYENYTAVAVTKIGELNHLFRAITCLEINDVDNFNLDLKQVIDNQDQILSSYILFETIVDQIINLGDDVINLPEKYKASSDAWRDDAVTKENGELKRLLRALDLTLGVSTSDEPIYVQDISSDSISLSNVIDNRSEILKSEILFETVVSEIKKQNGTLVIPEDYLNDDTNEKWKNHDGKNGELERLLNGASKIINFEENDSMNIDIDKIYLDVIINNKDEILSSKILTATFMKNIIDLNGDSLLVPTEYIEDSVVSDSKSTIWENTYDEKDNVITHGELSRLLDSLKLALQIEDGSNMNINSINTDQLDLYTIINNRNILLYSDILTATIVKNIKAMDDVITIPEEYLNDDISLWENKYENKTSNNVDAKLVIEGELSKLLESIRITLNLQEDSDKPLDSITADDILLYQVIEQRNEVLKSVIMTATIVSHIQDLDGDALYLPTMYKKETTNYLNNWENSYNDKEVTKEGELSKFLLSVQHALDINEQSSMDEFNNLSSNDLTLNKILTEKDNILYSEVMTSTIVHHIQTIDNDSIVIPEKYQDNDDISLWMNEYTDDKVVSIHGELSKFLTSIGIALEISEENDKSINDIDANSIRLYNIIQKKDNILYSEIMTATIVKNIQDLGNDGTLTIPTKYSSSTLGYFDLWKNQYLDDTVDNIDANVNIEGELSKFLDSVGNALELNEESDSNINNISVDNIHLVHIIDESDKILYSEVMMATFAKNIQDLNNQGLVIPKEYQGNDYDNWKNIYEDKYVVKTNGELSKFLTSIKVAMKLDSTSTDTVDNIDSKNIYLNTIIKEQDIILKSDIMTATFVSNIQDLDNNGINIPDQYNVREDITLWKNIYNNDKITKMELAHFITALGIAMNIDENTDMRIDEIDASKINLSQVMNEENSTIVLLSQVFSETLKVQIIENANDGSKLKLPEGYDDPSSINHIDWNNVYDNDNLVEQHELAYLLIGLNEIKDDDTSIDNMSSFNFNNLFDKEKQNIILKSRILSETIITEIMNSDSLIAPDGYKLKEANDRSEWYNQYQEFNINSDVSKYGEIAHLLNALNILLDDNNFATLDTSSIDYTKIFNLDYQDEILKSKVLSETIIHNLTNNEGVYIPENQGLTDNEISTNHRDNWFNIYQDDICIQRNELAAMLNAFNEILSDEQKNNLDNIYFSQVINQTLNVIQDEVKRTTILKSFVVCESIVCILCDQNAIKNHIEEAEVHSNKNFVTNKLDRSDWYKISVDDITHERNVEHLELWNILFASSRLLNGKKFADISEFSMDDMMSLTLNVSFNPVSYEIENSEIEMILNSYIMESIFAKLIETEGIFESFNGLITKPNDVKWYRNELQENEEYDLQNFLESLFLMKDYINYKNPNADTITHFYQMDDSSISKLGVSMVHSRIFKSSIAQMYNTFFEIPYKAALLIVSDAKGWDEVKFVQEEYDSLDRISAHDKFVTEFKTILDVIKQSL